MDLESGKTKQISSQTEIGRVGTFYFEICQIPILIEVKEEKRLKGCQVPQGVGPNCLF